MKKTSSLTPRAPGMFNDWVRATLPALVVVVLCVTSFRSAVLDSIQATSYPELVYLIFVAFFIALLLSWWVLYTYTREGAVLRRWQALAPSDRGPFIDALRRAPDLLPIYHLLSGRARLPLRMKQSALDSELKDLEKRLFSRLALPGYIGGSLIGLGLVGTFIGLVGTLKELVTLFSALIASQGDQALSQVEMFQDMIRRLQAPISGMSTAFVTSLYGLVGSMIVGLVVMTVRKAGAKLVSSAREGSRAYDHGPGNDLSLELKADGELAWAESERWRTMFEEMRAQNESLVQAILEMRHETRSVLESAADLRRALGDRNNLDDVISMALIEGSAAMTRANERYESILRCTEQTQTGIQAVVEATQSINDTLKERNRIDAMVHNVLDSGTHWMRAWDEISAETRRMRYALEQGAEQTQQREESQAKTGQQLLEAMLQIELGLKTTLYDTQQIDVQNRTEQRQVAQALNACRESIDEMNSKLRLLLSLPGGSAAP